MPGNGACVVARSLIGAAVGLIFRPKNDKIPWFYRLLDHFPDPHGNDTPHTPFEGPLNTLWKAFFHAISNGTFRLKNGYGVPNGVPNGVPKLVLITARLHPHNTAKQRELHPILILFRKSKNTIKTLKNNDLTRFFTAKTLKKTVLPWQL